MSQPKSKLSRRSLFVGAGTAGAVAAAATLLPGIVGFCVPVFDSDGHIALGIVALGPTGTFDPEWDGAVDRPLRAAARQLSSDLGYAG